jgi:hypothetical protein
MGRPEPDLEDQARLSEFANRMVGLHRQRPITARETTVPGFTGISACLQSGQIRRNITQNALSAIEKSGLRTTAHQRG